MKAPRRPGRLPRGRTAVQLVACGNCHTQFDVSGVQAKRFPCRCGARRREPPPAPVDAEIRRCGACGALTSPTSERCEYCRAAIRRDLRNLSLICPECYARNAEDSRFCTACGVTFRPEAGSPRRPRAALPRLRRADAAAADRRASASTSARAATALWVPDNDLRRARRARRRGPPQRGARRISRDARAAGHRIEPGRPGGPLPQVPGVRRLDAPPQLPEGFRRDRRPLRGPRHLARRRRAGADRRFRPQRPRGPRRP